MTGELRCAACGNFGYDVQPRIVQVEPEREVHSLARNRPVPERFKVEPRCIDHTECEDRVFAATEREPA